MIIVIFLVCVAIALIGVWLDKIRNAGFVSVCAAVCGTLGGIVSFIAMIVLLIDASYLSVIDDQIEMYQAENNKIESQIAECVKQYQQYESGIFTETTTESVITLVSLYPELKADTLVAKQIEVYLDNNKKIKELKERSINGDVTRWWAYFGGTDEKGGVE